MLRGVGFDCLFHDLETFTKILQCGVNLVKEFRVHSVDLCNQCSCPIIVTRQFRVKSLARKSVRFVFAVVGQIAKRRLSERHSIGLEIDQP